EEEEEEEECGGRGMLLEQHTVSGFQSGAGGEPPHPGRYARAASYRPPHTHTRARARSLYRDSKLSARLSSSLSLSLSLSFLHSLNRSHLTPAVSLPTQANISLHSLSSTLLSSPPFPLISSSCPLFS